MPYYTVGHTHNSQLVLTPMTFASIQDATNYINSVSNHSQYHIYQMNDTPINNMQANNTINLSGMSLEQYGKGYLLHPHQNDKRCGTKYFLNGWWMPTQNAWFFKKEFYNELVSYGAVDNANHHQTQNVAHQTDLVGMSVEQYGRGYLLRCQASHPSWGTKYFLDGWWMPNQNAWFFKSQYYDHLIELGATDESNNKTSNQSHNFKNMKWTKYGRGWLLIPSKKHHDVGEKYYHGGWWMPAKNAWFFKNEAKQAIC